MANLDLSKYGITDVKEVLHNPSYDVLSLKKLNRDWKVLKKDRLLNWVL